MSCLDAGSYQRLRSKYYRARYGDATIGRFSSEDPIGPGAVNLYTYTKNAPVNLVDPSGLSPKNRIPQRWRYCTGTEVSFCKDLCEKQGKRYESCRVSQTYRIGPKGWSAGPDWIDSVEGPNCSCGDKNECPRAPKNATALANPKNFLMMSGVAILVGIGIALEPELTIPALPKIIDALAH